jgi:cysteine desulfurase
MRGDRLGLALCANTYRIINVSIHLSSIHTDGLAMAPPRGRPIYFDTAATTRVAPEVREAMVQALVAPALFANPSSAEHGEAAAVIDQARAAIAAELACETDEVIFTSGATESINLALRGVALSYANHGGHIVTSKIEHKATLACCAALERDGFSVTYLAPNPGGVVSPQSVADALKPDTLLVSIMHTNNETGAMQPIEAIAALAAERGVLLHVDAAQAAGKFPINLTRTPIDLLSLSAHKFHGPKGIGCLAVRNRRRLRLQPLAYGGGQEFGLRPGTLPTHQILGLALAFTLAAARREGDLKHVATLRAQCVEALSNKLGAIIHGDPDCASPYILNFAVPGIRSDALINQTAAEIAIASGSACSSGAFEPSSVLRAMGIEGDSLYGAVRMSFDRSHTEDDIATAVEAITAAVQRMRMLDA